jgi:hypothetical protein
MSPATRERKNRKRLDLLLSLKKRDPERYEQERRRLLRVWSAEVWRRVGQRDLPPAAALIRTATLFGLGPEIAGEVVAAVRTKLSGPAFESRSVILPRDADPNAVAAWCEEFGFSAQHLASSEE